MNQDDFNAQIDEQLRVLVVKNMFADAETRVQCVRKVFELAKLVEARNSWSARQTATLFKSWLVQIGIDPDAALMLYTAENLS